MHASLQENSDSPREVIMVPTEKKKLKLAAAAYLAVLAYPEPKNGEFSQRDDFISACEAWRVKLTMGQLKGRLITQKNILKFSSYRKIESQFTKVHKIISEKRDVACVMAYYAIRQGGVGDKLILKIQGKEKFSIQRYLDKHYPAYEHAPENYNAHNARKRIWAASKPVIHLAHGLNAAIQSGKVYPAISSCITEPEWVLYALEQAEIFRKVLCASKSIDLCNEDTIQLLPKNST